jgi:molecular chaperone GrpE
LRPFRNRFERFVKLRKVDTDNPDQNPAGVSSAENVTTESVPAETLEGQLAAVTAERDQLVAERSDLSDRLLRARAEFENARRRTERERSDYLQFAAMDLVREILPILDDFERALNVETADRNYAKGVELIYQRLFDTARKMGLEPIETAGKPFDPNLHQAVERVQTTDAEDQAILGEFQRGYNFRGKLLRPAMVKVAVRP